MKLIALIAVVGLASCSPSAKLRKAERLIAEAEAAGLKWKIDTLWQTKFVIVPELRIDTLIEKVNFRDTLVVTKDKVVTKLKFDTLRRTIYVQTECPADTVKIEVPVQVIKEIKSGYTLWDLIILAIFCLIIGYFSHILVNSIRK